MKFATILFCFQCFIFSGYVYSQSINSGWHPQESGLNCKLNDVIFFDSLNYVCAGDTSIILTTSDGGITWVHRIAPSARIKSLDLVSSTSIFLFAYNEIYESTNGGSNWSYINTPPDIYDIDFIDLQTGFICGVDFSPVPVVFRTTNRGVDWNRYFAESLGFAEKIKMFDANSGRIVNANRIQTTTNGGVNWFNSNAQPVHYIYAVYSFNSNEHYAAGNSGLASRTTNGGSNWTAIALGTDLNIRCMIFTDSLTGYVAGDSGFISRTTDAGATWVVQNTNTTSRINDIEILDNGVGVAVGENGTILKTTTWGLTSFVQMLENLPKDYFLFQNYPNPFNPVTKIAFEILKRNFTTLKVYDINGRELKTLLNEEISAGKYEVDFDGANIPSGVYFYRLMSGNYSNVRSMIILK